MPPTLLLADDSITIQRVVELTFAEQGIKVISVSDGQEAIDRLTVQRPDIALVGVSLQKRDGYEVAGFIRREPSLRGVPVLLVAGAFDMLDESQVRESGAVGVLTKPFESKQVINRVKELLGITPKPAEPTVVVQTAAPPLGRLVTPSDMPHDADAVAAPPDGALPRRAEAMNPPPEVLPGAEADWNRLRQQSGLAPDAAAVEGPDAGGEDYFGHLDEAFDTLDAQLAGSSAPADRAGNPVAPTRYPAALDPGGRRPAAVETSPGMGVPAPAPVAAQPSSTPPIFAAGALGHAASAAGSNPVFEVDDKWFPTARARDVNDRPAVSSPAMADAFALMLAQEQGEVVQEPEDAPVQHYHQPAPIELSDDIIERIAQRVADRLIAGSFGERVARSVNEVSERLVREEIARIRASASARKP